MAPVARPELRRYWIEGAPQQRYALPEEIAPSVVFLASNAAAFMTGSVLVVDGGSTIWGRRASGSGGTEPAEDVRQESHRSRQSRSGPSPPAVRERCGTSSR